MVLKPTPPSRRVNDWLMKTIDCVQKTINPTLCVQTQSERPPMEGRYESTPLPRATLSTVLMRVTTLSMSFTVACGTVVRPASQTERLTQNSTEIEPSRRCSKTPKGRKISSEKTGTTSKSCGNVNGKPNPPPNPPLSSFSKPGNLFHL